MQILIAGSGSAGNATVFESRGTSVLVDAGVRPGPLAAKLRAAGLLEAPQAVIITHAHKDHVGHCARYAKKLKLPVYATEATARAAHLGPADRVRLFDPREPFTVGALTLWPMPLPHDAAQVALVVSDDRHRVALVTDLGQVPPRLVAHLAGCDVLLVESNHDLAMLRAGPYPAFLKQRVASAAGHLSNAQTGDLLRALPPGAHTVVLMHLSRTNNTPELALAAAREALAGRRAHLVVATQAGALHLDAARLPPTEALPGAPARRPEQLTLWAALPRVLRRRPSPTRLTG